jgi:hypothetical protein
MSVPENIFLLLNSPQTTPSLNSTTSLNSVLSRVFSLRVTAAFLNCCGCGRPVRAGRRRVDGWDEDCRGFRGRPDLPYFGRENAVGASIEFWSFIYCGAPARSCRSSQGATTSV